MIKLLKLKAQDINKHHCKVCVFFIFLFLGVENYTLKFFFFFWDKRKNKKYIFKSTFFFLESGSFGLMVFEKTKIPSSIMYFTLFSGGSKKNFEGGP